MKFYNILAILLVAAATIKASEIVDKCREEHDISEDVIEAFFEDPENEVPEEIKCFLKCILEEENILVDGEFNTTNISQEESISEELMENCTAEKGETECDTAYTFLTGCKPMYDKAKELFEQR